MAIISGVNIPDNKRVEISLTGIFGIGPFQAKDIIDKAGI
ncbi:MAG: 30S ribosomal protein S13, partial [Chloroflexi bacterium]|nr:30S ribosomal protein S13 [Chloroflexota bacterium]